MPPPPQEVEEDERPPLRKLHATSSESASNLRSLLSPRAGDNLGQKPLPPRSALQKKVQKQVPEKKKKKNPHRVLVLLTGGTMAMKANDDGALEPAVGYLAAKMRSMGELRDPKMPSYEVTEYSPLLDSADMVPSDWSTIALDIVERYEEFDGFVVILGTDTLAFCASALSFMLEDLEKPVVLTGSMVPFCEAHTDARRNLVMSLIFAGGLSVVGSSSRGRTPGEVLVFFHDRLLRGSRASKVDALGLQAFDSPNFPALATVGVAVNDNFGEDSPKKAEQPEKKMCSAMTSMETRIVVIRVIPGFDDGALAACFSSASLRAVVLETYGTGTAPSRRKHLVDALALARNNGVLVVATTQCRRGGVVMSHYAVGQALLDVGVLSAGDMTTEAAATKLAFLFGKYPDSDLSHIRRLFATSLRGELSPPEKYTRPFFEDDSDPVLPENALSSSGSI